MANPHVERMIAEADALTGNIDKLVAFLTSDIYANLDALKQSLLQAQLSVMITYHNILSMRIQNETISFSK